MMIDDWSLSVRVVVLLSTDSTSLEGEGGRRGERGQACRHLEALNITSYYDKQVAAVIKSKYIDKYRYK